MPKESNERCDAALQTCMRERSKESQCSGRECSLQQPQGSIHSYLTSRNVISPFLSLPEVVNPSLSTEPAVTFSEGDARRDNTDVPRDPPVVSSGPVTRPKAKQAPGMEAENVVGEEVHYTPEELNEFANSGRSLGNLCRNGF